MQYPIESLPPEYQLGDDPYLDSIRQQHSIPDVAQGQEVRDMVRAIWSDTLRDSDGFNSRVQLMEILMGDRVGGEEVGSLGYLYYHLKEPETFEAFLGGVAAAKGWIEEDRSST